MEKQLTVELNGIKYLLFEVPMTNGDSDKLNIKVEKYDGIIQGVGEIHRSFWGNNYLICNILIPEKNVIEFSRDNS